MDANLEKKKYEKAWSHEAYRSYAPGEILVKHYVEQCRPHNERLIDFGTGTGRAALILHKLGFDVTMIDIAENCLDEDVQKEIGNRLVIGNLWDKMDLPKATEGYCTDVMEHIPPEHVEDTIKNILSMVDYCFFHICLREDHFGRELDEHLHLTVKPYMWWKELLEKHAKIFDARDLINNGWFYVKTKG